MLGTCEVDFRVDLRRSTEVALQSLSRALDDDVLKASGAAVQIAIASHHAGYDDRQFYEGSDKPSKPYNLLAAYERWTRQRDLDVPTSKFYGAVMTCRDLDEPEPGCQKYMVAETQRYTPTIIGYFLAAVCYYGKNYPQERTFAPWARFSDEGGYCERIDVPLATDLVGGGQ